jgi:hypothetical protein
MKKKLQKDLRLLKKVWVRFIISFIFAFIGGAISDNGWGFLIVLPLCYILLYLFIAWLYGDEDETNS